jgi:hypothetical protein
MEEGKKCGDCELWMESNECEANYGNVYSGDDTCILFRDKIEAPPKEALFFKELESLLERYNACILRSANDTHELVVSIKKESDEFVDIVFEEEISDTDARNMWQSITKRGL